MKIILDITQNIQKQFAQQLGMDIDEGLLAWEKELGKGQMQLTKLPQGLEFYNFRYRVHEPIELNSQNPPESDWLLLNINLSKHSVEKTVNNQELQFQRYLPSGILCYTPGTQVVSFSKPDLDFHILLIRFPKALLSAYFEDEWMNLTSAVQALMYEDLSHHMELALYRAIQNQGNKIKCHAAVLEFLGLFVDKLRSRSKEASFEQLHPQDLKGLFLVSAHLRNPLAAELPAVPDLARLAGMGTTKFKTIFKQVFGLPPMQYHLKIKMQYALEELQNRRQTASELSYALGYSHPSKFTQAFKKQFQLLPSEV